MSDFVEQRINIKFCLRNGITAAETLRMLQKAFGDQVMSKKNIYKWYKEFQEGRESVNDKERAGREKTSTDDRHIKEIKSFVLENRRWTVRELADAVGISAGSVNTILKDVLNIKGVSSRLVPKMLNFLEKERRLNTCEEMISDYLSVTERIITGDETWIGVHNVKVMLTVYFDYRGIVHYEFLPVNQTANKEYHFGVMCRLREAICRKRPDLWVGNSWFLHLDYVPSHTACQMQDYFIENSMHIVPQPPHSPDLAPFDFFLYPRLKKSLRGNNFESTEEIQCELLKELEMIREEEFSRCFDDWKTRWHRCIAAGGSYFERDSSDVNE